MRLNVALITADELDTYDREIAALQKGLAMANVSLEALRSQVEQTNTVIGSAVTLIQGISATLQTVRAELAAQQVQNETLDSLAASLDATEQALAAAVEANSGAPAAS